MVPQSQRVPNLAIRGWEEFETLLSNPFQNSDSLLLQVSSGISLGLQVAMQDLPGMGENAIAVDEYTLFTV